MTTTAIQCETHTQGMTATQKLLAELVINMLNEDTAYQRATIAQASERG